MLIIILQTNFLYFKDSKYQNSSIASSSTLTRSMRKTPFYKSSFYPPQGKYKKKYSKFVTNSVRPFNPSSGKTRDKLGSQNCSFIKETEFQDQLLCMDWNKTGSSLCGCFSNNFTIWQLRQSGLSQVQKKNRFNLQIQIIKYSNEYVFGGMCQKMVKFWDSRMSIKKQIQDLSLENKNYQWSVFDIYQQNNLFSVGSYENVCSYDFRFIKQRTNLGCINSEIPINSIKWCENDQVLVTAGGIDNKGIIGFYNGNLLKILELNLCSAEITSISIDDQFTTLSTLSQDNVIAIFELPDILCSSTIELTDDKHVSGCSMSASKKYISALLKKQIQIFKVIEERLKKIFIKKYSPHIWHPKSDILCFVDENDDDNVTLIKL